MNIIDAGVSALVQVVLFLAVPFIWWLVSARTREGFLRWLGWTRPRVARPGALVSLMIALYLLYLVPGVVLVSRIDAEAATDRFSGGGWAGLIAVALWALVQTSFTEESLFRGFLLARLSPVVGFHCANAVQAILFSLLHAAALLAVAGAAWVVLIVVFTAAVGWSMGFLNERLAGGSIVPGWLLHAAANLTTGCLTLAGIL